MSGNGSQPTEIVSESLRKEIARHSVKYFTPWRVALRKWIKLGCPTVWEMLHPITGCGKKYCGIDVVCAFCDTSEYFHEFPACLDCPYNSVSDALFEDMAQFTKDL